jgi:diguanylate cyclase
MAFLRRQEDIGPPKDNDPDRMIAALRRTATMLISAIQFLAEDHGEEKTDEFKQALAEETQRLSNESALEELRNIHRRLKQLVFQHNDQEKLHRQKQLEEYSEIADTLGKSLTAFGADNVAFTDQLDGRLRRIRGAVELEELKQVRTEVSQQIGVLRCLMEEKQRQDAQHQQTLTTQIQNLNSQIDIAHKQTRFDALTGVYNRRAFDEHLQHMLRRSQKIAGSAFGLMLFDIDYFKQVNDTHGHQIGDRVLVAVVQKAKQSLRTGDFIARYGGDEFAIILRDDSMTNAHKILERLRAVIAQGFLYKREDGKDQMLQVTISGGIAWSRQSDTDASLIARADKALYLAKARGRNQIYTEKDLLDTGSTTN